MPYVNLFAVVVAALASMSVGFVWYHPKVFGTIWMRAARLSPDTVEVGKKRIGMISFVAFAAALIMSYAVSYFAYMWGVLTLGNALELAFWMWSGCVVPVTLASVLWEGKPWKLFIINAGYWLVTFILVSVIVGLWI